MSTSSQLSDSQLDGRLRQLDFVEAADLAASSAACPIEEADEACCCLFPAGRQQQPYAHQSLSSLATCSTSSRSSACEVAASTEWLQQDGSLGPATSAAVAASTSDPDADPSGADDPDVDAGADATARPMDKLRSSLHSLRLGSRHSPGAVTAGAKSNSALCVHEAPRPHHHHHQHPMSRGGVTSRRRSSAISAKSKAQYIAQYKAAKVSYFRAVIGGQAPVKERPRGSELDSAWR